MTLEEKTVKILKEKGLVMACAESCTGGLIAKRITDVSGSSAVFNCGIVSYSNEIKSKVLGVSEKTLETKTEWLNAESGEKINGSILLKPLQTLILKH